MNISLHVRDPLFLIFLTKLALSRLLLLLLLLALQPTVGFSLLSDSLPFCSFFTLLPPPSYSHYLQIFFNACNPSFRGLPLVLVPIGFHCNILLGATFEK